MRRSRLLVALTAATAVTIGVPVAADAAPKPKPAASVPVQLIAMNDFHGRIQNTAGNDAQLITDPGTDQTYGTPDDVTTTVGGAANVASTVKQLQASFAATSGEKSGSWFVGAGDLISASPFVSSAFKDEPTIEVLNAMGLDASSVGNHEFDRGTEELRRITAPTDGTYTDDVTACQGVTAGVDGCFTDSTGAAFHGTDFPYLAANVISKETGAPMLPPYQVFDIPGGKKIGLIGVVTEDTPNIVSPTGVADVKFIDEADAVNQWASFLQRRGVSAIGVLIHEGGEQKGAAANSNGCDSLAGSIVDINNRISNQVDLIVSAHTHQAYNCLLPVPSGQDRLVTSAGYYGRMVSDIRLTLDGTTGDVNRTATYSALNVPVTRTDADTRVQTIVDYWTAQAQKANPVVGSVTADITRAYKPGTTTEDRENESSLGNLIAQTQLVALQQPQYGNPVIGFMNPGGLRADILFGKSASGEAPGVVTYSELAEVQPFGNTLGATTLTGADIKQVLEEQFQVRGARSRLMLGTSEGFAFSYDLSRAYGDRITSVTLNGVPIDPSASYRIVTNTFLLGGGDQFPSFMKGTNTVSGPVDLEATVAYFQTHSPVAPPPVNHTTQVG